MRQKIAPFPSFRGFSFVCGGSCCYCSVSDLQSLWYQARSFRFSQPRDRLGLSTGSTPRRSSDIYSIRHSSRHFMAIDASLAFLYSSLDLGFNPIKRAGWRFWFWYLIFGLGNYTCSKQYGSGATRCSRVFGIIAAPLAIHWQNFVSATTVSSGYLAICWYLYPFVMSVLYQATS